MKTAPCRFRTKAERLRQFGAVLALASLALACTKPKDGVGAAPSSSAATTSALPSAAASSSSHGPTGPAPNGNNAPVTDPMATLFGSMSTELTHRPNVHPNVDDGFAALKKADIVVDAKQSLGRTYQASYCAHGKTAALDLSVLLCEYTDADKAAAALVESKKLFPGDLKRKTQAHKTLLIVTSHMQESQPAATAAEEVKVYAAFNAL